jgi:hypothetical protein
MRAMIDKLSDPELCGLTSADESTVVAECIDGLGCVVYGGGKELPPWAGNKVEELVDIYVRDKALITTNSEPQYFILKRDDKDDFSVLRGPLNAADLRGIFSHKVIAAVACPKCGREYALVDTPLFESGTEPRKFPGPQTITFLCCGDAQTVQAESVKYRPQRQFI